jgi:tryptophan halogenase
MKQVKKLLVVGGGSAGLITALILKKKLDIQIDVVHSKNIGIIGVGEGSTEHFKEFMNFIGIDQYQLIKECDATYKCGIMFENWGSKDYLHTVAHPFNKKTAQYAYTYGKQISENSSYMQHNFFWKNQINSWFLNRREEFPANQFHFNTHKLNEFLIKLAKFHGINVIEDEIDDIVLDENGYIKNLKGVKNSYHYDFYIDSTGFRRILMNKLGAKWNSYVKYLKMKAAIVFPTEDEENYNFWTLARAMNNGWMFRIPVWGRYGNGYIFDSDYTDAISAKKEVEECFGREINIGKEFRFDPGALENVWIKNCCAVGLSGSFVEPLEASSIGTSIQQAFLLMHKLPAYDDNVIKSYNKSMNDIMENIRDFIALHYITDKNDSLFWKDLKKIEIPDTLKSKLELWKNKLPIKEDFCDLSNYILFTEDNFTLVLDGLNFFDRDSIRKEYHSTYEAIRHDAERTVHDAIQFEHNMIKMSHKKFISLVRNFS